MESSSSTLSIDIKRIDDRAQQVSASFFASDAKLDCTTLLFATQPRDWWCGGEDIQMLFFAD